MSAELSKPSANGTSLDGEETPTLTAQKGMSRTLVLHLEVTHAYIVCYELFITILRILLLDSNGRVPSLLLSQAKSKSKSKGSGYDKQSTGTLCIVLPYQKHLSPSSGISALHLLMR